MKIKVSNSPTQSEFDEIDLSLTTRRGAEYVVGRSPDSDLVLDSEDVSRRHGKFFSQSGNYYFCDLGSRNGTIYNGKSAEKNHSYILKNGDIIRIGDFALIIEEDISFSEQSETVVRIINPSIFSNRQSNKNLSVPNVATPSSELVNQSEQVPEPVISESIAFDRPIVNEVENAEEFVNTSEELTFVQSDQAFPVNSADIIIPNNTVELQEDSEISDAISNESVDSDTVVQEEPTANISGVEYEYTIVQVRDVFQDDEDNIESDTEEIAVHDEIDAQQTISQEDNLESDAEEIAVHDEIDAQQAISQEDNLSDAEEIAVHDEIDAQQAISQEDNLSDAEEIAVHDEIDAQQAISQEDNLSDAEEIAVHDEIDAQQAISQEDNLESDAEEIAVYTQEGNIVITEEVREELVSEAIYLSTSEMLIHEESNVIISQPIKEAPVEDIPEEESLIELAKILEDKQIVLISHETKKSELIKLVTEHEEFLSYCLTRTWQTFSDYLYRETGLSVTQGIPAATSGGYQAINSLINSGEVIAVIFLRDFIVPQPGQASEEALLRTCNINEILLATNLPTAQAVIHYLKNMKDS